MIFLDRPPIGLPRYLADRYPTIFKIENSTLIIRRDPNIRRLELDLTHEPILVEMGGEGEPQIPERVEWRVRQ